MSSLSLLALLNHHHEESYDHSLRVSNLSFWVSCLAGLTTETCSMALQAGLLHDIGKIFVPIEILKKTGPLTDEEYSTVRLHVTKGVELLKEQKYPSMVVASVEGHHEREDGRGYPKGTRNNTKLARIVAICDVFDAMTKDRGYRAAGKEEDILDRMSSGDLGAFHMQYLDLLRIAVMKGKARHNRKAPKSQKKFPATKVL